MSTEKYTQKTLEAIRDAQALAQEKSNQYLTPEHLLYALLKQDGGLIGSIFSRMGVDCWQSWAPKLTSSPRYPAAVERSMPRPRRARSSPWRKRQRRSYTTNISPWSI